MYSPHLGIVKNQLLSKIVLPEKLCCIDVDPLGDYCAGGTASGRLYLWEASLPSVLRNMCDDVFIQIASGILFNSFEAHYRRLSVLRFTRDGAGLVSVSDDSGVNVWSMSRSFRCYFDTKGPRDAHIPLRLLDEDLQTEVPTPYCSFSEHTLPVTDVLCGIGAFTTCRIFTSSIDHSVKVNIPSQ